MEIKTLHKQAQKYLKKEKKERDEAFDYFILAPQLGQNLVPAATSVPHFGHLTVACIAVPQLTQNFAVVGFSVPHLGHLTVAACACAAGCNVVPQLLQNFDVCGFWKPHFGQTTMTC